MIDICIEISKLLFVQKQVIIPSLGIFTVELKEAYMHPVNHEFSPKFKKISFTKNLFVTDKILSQKLNDANADELISSYVANIQQELETAKEFYFQNIGWLKIHATGNWIFEQDEKFNYHKNFFGLGEFTQAPVIVQSAVELAASPKAIHQESKSNKKLIWILAISAAAILIAAFVFFQQDLFFKTNEPLIVKEVSQPEINIVEEVSNSAIEDNLEADTIIEDSIQDSYEENVVVNNDVQIEESIPNIETEVTSFNSDKKYFVIAGCFRSEKKAEDYLNEIKQKGYIEASIEGKTPQGLTRVCYAGFTSNNEASLFLKEVSDKEGKSLWIQKITE